MTKPTVLIHISDIHFVNDQSLLRGLLENGKVLTKRHLGWLNYKLRRSGHFQPDLKQRLFEKLEKIDWNYLVISGDLTTLSLDREFLIAREAIAPLQKKGTVILTAGNHDRYISHSNGMDPVQSHFKDFWPYNSDENPKLLTLSDDAVLIEIDMAHPRVFFSSRGKLRTDLANLKKIVKNEYKNKIKISIGHYPAFLPPGEQEGYFHQLSNIEELQNFLLDLEIDYYLHGHIHKSWSFRPSEQSKLISINSGGCCRHLNGEWAGFHKIEIADGSSTVERICL